MGDLQPWLLIGGGGFLVLGLLLLLLRPGRRADVKVGTNSSNNTIINVAGDYNSGGSASAGPSAGWQWFFGWAGIILGLIGIALSVVPMLKG